MPLPMKFMQPDKGPDSPSSNVLKWQPLTFHHQTTPENQFGQAFCRHRSTAQVRPPVADKTDKEQENCYKQRVTEMVYTYDMISGRWHSEPSSGVETATSCYCPPLSMEADSVQLSAHAETNSSNHTMSSDLAHVNVVDFLKRQRFPA